MNSALFLQLQTAENIAEAPNSCIFWQAAPLLKGGRWAKSKGQAYAISFDTNLACSVLYNLLL